MSKLSQKRMMKILKTLFQHSSQISYTWIWFIKKCYKHHSENVKNSSRLISHLNMVWGPPMKTKRSISTKKIWNFGWIL